MQPLQDLLLNAEKEIFAAVDLKSLDSCRVVYLGKKGLVTEQLKNLGRLNPNERPAAGQKINAIKETILSLLDERENQLKKALVQQQLTSEQIDITLPGRSIGLGSVHPISQTFEELRNLFTRMGFLFMEGPEIESDFYNFTALNIPPLHPARAMQDTFYFEDGLLLRSQMSPVQIHAMKKLLPPFRMVAMGRVYRHDFDITHTPMFHQLECLVVDKNLTFANLKGLIKDFLHAFFFTEAAIRFRPSYFPFTEPSAEVDMQCLKCMGKKECRICKNSGWLEILGCGMVHPNVLDGVGINSKVYKGFAFGLGIDRMTLLKYGITDLRTLFENDLRFLKQF